MESEEDEIGPYCCENCGKEVSRRQFETLHDNSRRRNMEDGVCIIHKPACDLASNETIGEVIEETENLQLVVLMFK